MLKPFEKLQALMARHKWTQQQAAEVFGVAQATVFRWKENKSEPEGHHRDAIDEAYRETFGSRMSIDTMMVPMGIPVVGRIQAGAWLDTTLMDDSYDEHQIIPLGADPRFPYAKQYALEVIGDSMNREYPEGTFVICVEFDGSGLEQKDDMIVHVEQWRHDLREITLKALKRDGKRWRLEPRSTNDAHKPIFMNGEPADDTEIRLRGVVIGDYRRRVL